MQSVQYRGRVRGWLRAALHAVQTENSRLETQLLRLEERCRGRNGDGRLAPVSQSRIQGHRRAASQHRFE